VEGRDLALWGRRDGIIFFVEKKKKKKAEIHKEESKRSGGILGTGLLRWKKKTDSGGSWDWHNLCPNWKDRKEVVEQRE